MRGGVLYAGSAGAPAYSKAKKVRTRGAGRALASSRRRSSCTGAFAHLLQQSESVRRRRQRPSPRPAPPGDGFRRRRATAQPSSCAAARVAPAPRSAAKSRRGCCRKGGRHRPLRSQRAGADESCSLTVGQPHSSMRVNDSLHVDGAEGTCGGKPQSSCSLLSERGL